MGAGVPVVLDSRPWAASAVTGETPVDSGELGHWACSIHREGSVPLLIPRTPAQVRATGYLEPGIIPRG